VVLEFRQQIAFGDNPHRSTVGSGISSLRLARGSVLPAMSVHAVYGVAKVSKC
jgi:hypothetical protein